MIFIIMNELSVLLLFSKSVKKYFQYYYYVNMNLCDTAESTPLNVLIVYPYHREGLIDISHVSLKYSQAKR